MPRLERLTPVTVSHEDGWRLFDRSVSSGYTPGEQSLIVSVDPGSRVAVLKVRGPAPYQLSLSGASGTPMLDAIDLSSLAVGWHVRHIGRAGVWVHNNCGCSRFRVMDHARWAV